MQAHRILVTGASGFLGGHVVAALQRAGHVVSTPARSGGDAAVDLLAPGMVDAVAEALQPEFVVHLAAPEALAAAVVETDGPDLVHLPGLERTSRWELARRFCLLHGLDVSLLRPVECQDGSRPRDVSLAGSWQADRSLEAMLADSLAP